MRELKYGEKSKARPSLLGQSTALAGLGGWEKLLGTHQFFANT